MLPSLSTTLLPSCLNINCMFQILPPPCSAAAHRLLLVEEETLLPRAVSERQLIKVEDTVSSSTAQHSQWLASPSSWRGEHPPPSEAPTIGKYFVIPVYSLDRKPISCFRSINFHIEIPLHVSIILANEDLCKWESKHLFQFCQIKCIILKQTYRIPANMSLNT